MNIGTPLSMSLLYPVSRDRRQLDRPFLKEHRGCCHRKVRWIFRVSILCKHYRPYLCNCPSQLANDARIGGILPLVAP